MAEPSSSEVQYQLNHINDNKSIEMVTSQICGMVIAFVAVALRFLSRRVGRVPILTDDYMTVVALFFAFGEAISTLVCVRLGGGKHAVLMVHPIDHAKDVFAVELLYNPAIATAKFSVLLLYRRIFPNQHFRTMLWCLGGFVLAYSIVQTIATIFHCIPVQAAWNPAAQGRCININAVFVTMGVLNAITDFVTLFLPMPMLWSLQMPKARKAQVILIFLLGGFVCIVSAYRVTKLNIQLTDASYTDADAAIWSTVEVCVAIVCACLPTLRPLFHRKRAATTGSNSHPKHTGGASIDVRRGYSVRSLQGTDLARLGSSHQMLAPTTWTDIEGGAKTGVAFQVREVGR